MHTDIRRWNKTLGRFCFGLVVVLVFAHAAAGSTVAIVKGEDPDKMVEEAINLVGGIQQFARAGSTIVIKPNLTCCSRMHPDASPPGANTDPRIVRALIKLIKRTAQCHIIIADASQAPGSVIFKMSGYTQLAEEFGIPLVDLAEDQRVTVKIDGLAQKEYQMPVTTQKCDVLIDVAVLKTHTITGITAGMKNLFGLMPKRRESLHNVIHKVICDLSTIRMPDLTIIDALTGMEGQGPVDGDPVKMDLIIAGKDIVAVDSVSTTIMGFEPEYLQYLVYANQKGLGEIDINKITIKGVPVSEVKRNFKPALADLIIEKEKSDELIAKITALADRVETEKKYKPFAYFNPERLKTDNKKYPLRKSYGFKVGAFPWHNTMIQFLVPYEAIYAQNKDAAHEEIEAWIAENLK